MHHDHHLPPGLVGLHHAMGLADLLEFEDPRWFSFIAACSDVIRKTYISLCWELICRTPVDVPSNVRRMMRVRSIATRCLFGMATAVVLKNPLLGLGICCCCLIFYLRPGASGAESVQ